MSGICDTCKREHCHSKMDGLKSCDFYHGGETRYHKLFGTPERVTLTLEKTCSRCDGRLACDDCVIGEMRGFNHTEDALLEWLRGDAE